MDLEKIGKYIAKCRKEQGLTQEELALHLGITAKAVSKWECGKGLPDISIMLELCYILGINIISLLMGENSNTEYYIRRTGGSMNRKEKIKRMTKTYPQIGDLSKSTVTKIKNVENAERTTTIEGTVIGFQIWEKEYIIRCDLELSDDTGTITVVLKDNGITELKNMITKVEVGQTFRVSGSLGKSTSLCNKNMFFVKSIQKIEHK